MKLISLRQIAAFVEGTGWLAVAQAFAIVCGLLTTVIWARAMPSELFGEYRVLMGIVTFVSTLCLLGSGQSALMSAARGLGGNFQRIFRWKIFANTLASIGLASAAYYYSYIGSFPLALGLVAAAVFFPLYNLYDVWTSWFNGENRLRLLALSQCLFAGSSMVVIVIAAIIRIEILWLIVAIHFSLVSALSVLAIISIGRRIDRSSDDPAVINLGHHSSLALGVGGIVALDVVILNHAYSAEDVATYFIALQFPQMLSRVLAVFSLKLSSRMYADRSFHDVWQSVRSDFWISTLACIALGFVGIFLLPPLTIMLFGERYAEAAQFGQWLWFSMAILGAPTLLSSLLIATKNPIFIYIPQIGYPLLLCALFFLFLGDGVAGLTVARILSVLALAIFYVASFLVLYRMSNKSAVQQV
jgi:O-antigen/teichoic acid export membrane protein